MFSPQKDMKDLVVELLKKDQMSISGLSRELASKGVKLHRLELTGYLKALADMGVLREKDIKPAKVFSTSSSRDKGLHESLGDACSSLMGNHDDRATLAVYCLQKIFKRPIFELELRRCGVEGTPEGRKATSEERAEAKAIMTRLGYKVPNSDIPTIVDKNLESEFAEVLAEVIVERFNVRSFMRQTTQTKL